MLKHELRFWSIVVFAVLSAFAILGALGIVIAFCPYIHAGEFNSLVKLSVFGLLSFGLILMTYRSFLSFYPIEEGEVKEHTFQEAVFQVHLLFYLFFFYPLIRSRFIPIAMNRLIYLCLGAKWGRAVYCAGVALDPSLITVGDYTLLGQDCVLYAHVIEGKRLSHHAIHIGTCVTVGANAVIMPGVTIGDNAIIAAGSVVTKGTAINASEIWGGVPAQKLDDCLPPDST